MNLRPRETEKELGPPSFRYRPNNYFEKVTDAVKNRNPGPIAQANETFAPNLLNKKGELAKNLKPLPAGYQYEERRQRGQRNGDFKAKERSQDDDLKKMSTTTPAGESDTPSNLEDAEKRSIDKKKNSIQIGGVKLRDPRSINLSRIARPKYLLPTLHEKTHFKAALEYSLGTELTHRSLHDKGGKVERAIFEEY